MNNNINEIKDEYRDCNLLMPTSTETQINPFYKFTVTTVKADVSESSGDIFKVGSSKIGNDWVDVYSPAKPLLMKQQKQKHRKQSTNVEREAKYIRLLEMTRDLTDIEVDQVRDYVSSLKSQRIQ